MYNSNIMNMFENIQNAGFLRGANGVGTVEGKCGEVSKVYVKVENDAVVEAKFKTFGSILAIVATSVACEVVKGKSIKDARTLKVGDIIKMTGMVEEDKIYCLTFALDAINSALDDFELNDAKERIKALKEAGKPVPKELEETVKTLRQKIND